MAVLPFVTSPAGGNSQEEYVAFGMTDAIIAELSRAGGLDVISQTSSVRYRGATKSLPEIARELGAAAVVEGSIVREGDQVRITVQLIDPGETPISGPTRSGAMPARSWPRRRSSPARWREPSGWNSPGNPLRRQKRPVRSIPACTRRT